MWYKIIIIRKKITTKLIKTYKFMHKIKQPHNKAIFFKKNIKCNKRFFLDYKNKLFNKNKWFL